MAQGFDFPTSVAFADDGTLYVAESGLPFGGARPGGRIVRVETDGRRTVVLDGLRQPVNGLTWHAGGFYIAEGGFPGRISRWVPGDAPQTILDGLPGRGNYHTNMIAVGPDGWLYFSQGAMTNSGVVGLDAYDLAWLKTLPHPFDVPGYDIALAGQTFETDDPLAAGPRRARRRLPSRRSAMRRRRAHASPAVCRVRRRCCAVARTARHCELFAWGLRNAYGLAFLPDGRLLATDQGADDRGSRPIGNAPDLLYVVEQGRWYGWPDFIGGRPVTDPAFKPHAAPQPQFLLANHAALPPPQQPVLRFAVNAAATKLALLPKSAPRWPGQLLVALFGDEKPMTAPAGARVGRRLVRVDPHDWSLHPFDAGPFTRPIDVQPAPDGRSVLVVDFGHFEMLGKGRIDAAPGSGKLWSVRLG